MTEPSRRDAITTAISDLIAQVEPDLPYRLGTDPEAPLDLIRITREISEVVDGIERDAVRSARSAGASWESIGEVLA